MIVPEEVWQRYVDLLAKVDKTATEKMAKYIEKHPIENASDIDAWIAYAFGLSTKYGEAAAALAAEMYDEIGAAEGEYLDPADPAATATLDEVARTVAGVHRDYADAMMVAMAVGRLVKRAGADTMLQNAARDGAYYAWIPMGDTCAFCLAIAAEGWKKAYADAMKDGHAEHIHANCNCNYAIKHKPDTEFASYKEPLYKRIFRGVEGDTPKEKVNSVRRMFYEQNKEEINAQKRAAYQKRQELNSPEAEEMDVS